jgi:hypothetical protein
MRRQSIWNQSKVEEEASEKKRKKFLFSCDSVVVIEMCVGSGNT